MKKVVFIICVIMLAIFSIIQILSRKQVNIDHISCSSEYTVMSGETYLFSSLSITQGNNKGLTLLVGDYLTANGKKIQIRISKPFTYTQSKNTFHSESNSIFVIPSTAYDDADLLHLLPIFLTETHTEVAYSIIPLTNGDYIIQQGIIPVLYCINNKK